VKDVTKNVGVFTTAVCENAQHLKGKSAMKMGQMMKGLGQLTFAQWITRGIPERNTRFP